MHQSCGQTDRHIHRQSHRHVDWQ